MKLSKTPTGHIIIRAITNSEWDSVDVAIVEVVDWTLSQIEKNMELAKYVSDHTDKWSSGEISFSNAAADFFCLDPEELADGEDYDTITGLLSGEYGEWSWLDMEGADEVENHPAISSPQNTLDMRQTVCDYEGFSFRTYGKHTGEEFSTHRIPYTDFFDASEKPQPPPKQIIVRLEGGRVVDVTGVPDDVELFIRDYDTDGGGDDLRQDENGEEYYHVTW